DVGIDGADEREEEQPAEVLPRAEPVDDAVGIEDRHARIDGKEGKTCQGGAKDLAEADGKGWVPCGVAGDEDGEDRAEECGGDAKREAAELLEFEACDEAEADDGDDAEDDFAALDAAAVDE